jgi:hypothetical protein
MKSIQRLILVVAMGAATGVQAADGPPAPKADKASVSAPAARTGTQKTMDRVELGTTAITGNQELPKVMYVVPWKRADQGDLGGRPLHSLVDEILAPLDRQVFRREVDYFEILDSGRKAEAEKSVTAGKRAP